MGDKLRLCDCGCGCDGFAADRVDPADRDTFVSRVFLENVSAAFNRSQALLLGKHNDYGPKNISASPGGPVNGLRVRLWDKIARLNHLYETDAEPENESMYDTFQDIANYGIIGMLVLDGEWPAE